MRPPFPDGERAIANLRAHYPELVAAWWPATAPGSRVTSSNKPETTVAELCAELGSTRQTLYRHVTPKGEIRPDGEKLLVQRA